MFVMNKIGTLQKFAELKDYIELRNIKGPVLILSIVKARMVGFIVSRLLVALFRYDKLVFYMENIQVSV